MVSAVFRRVISAWVLVCIGFGTPVFAQADQQLLDAAKTEMPAFLNTLERLVTTESGSGNTGGLASVADQIDRHLTALGFATARHPSGFGAKADTVVGTKTGSGTQRVVLMAHTDTVYASGILVTFTYRVEDDRIYGPGVADSKSGVAMILHTLEILNDAGWDDFAELTVLFNPDEEVGSTGSHQLITELAAEADTVLSFEPTWSGALVNYYFLLGHAAYAQVRLEIKGVAGHASTPEQGKNAVMELAHQMLATHAIAEEMSGAQLTWTNIKADQAFNQIPGLAVAVADGRITEPGADVALLAAMQEQVRSNKLIDGTEATVTLEILRPMFLANDATKDIIVLANRIHQEIRFCRKVFSGLNRAAFRKFMQPSWQTV